MASSWEWAPCDFLYLFRFPPRLLSFGMKSWTFALVGLGMTKEKEIQGLTTTVSRLQNPLPAPDWRIENCVLVRIWQVVNWNRTRRSSDPSTPHLILGADNELRGTNNHPPLETHSRQHNWL